MEKEGRGPKKEGKLFPQQFLAESSKTAITGVVGLAPRDTVVKMAPGDPVTLEIADNSLIARNGGSERLGQVPLRLAVRLIRLMKGGNRYAAAVTSAGSEELAIIIREVYQSPDQREITFIPGSERQGLPTAPGEHPDRVRLPRRRGRDR